jgi:hypothetical protein
MSAPKRRVAGLLEALAARGDDKEQAPTINLRHD